MSLLDKADRKLIAMALGVVVFAALAITGTIEGETALAAIVGILASAGVHASA